MLESEWIEGNRIFLEIFFCCNLIFCQFFHLLKKRLFKLLHEPWTCIVKSDTYKVHIKIIGWVKSHKVNSVQEAFAKCFAVHILKFEILQITWKGWNKEYQTPSFQFFTNRLSILMFLVLFFHLVCKISNFNKWTAKHSAKASCTELTLHGKIF